MPICDLKADAHLLIITFQKAALGFQYRTKLIFKKNLFGWVHWGKEKGRIQNQWEDIVYGNI